MPRKETGSRPVGLTQRLGGAPSLPAKLEPGGLLDPAFPPSPHPRSASEAAPAHPALTNPLCPALRSQGRGPALPTPTPAWRPSEAAFSSRVFPDHTWSPLPGILSNSCGLGAPPRPKGGGQVCHVPASTQSSPWAQQGLRKGSVVRLQFILVETEAQEMREPPCPPPKGTFATRVSFPQPLTLQSSQDSQHPTVFRGRPHPAHSLHQTLLPRGLCTCSPRQQVCPPPLLVLQECRGHRDRCIYSCRLISPVALRVCSHHLIL